MDGVAYPIERGTGYIFLEGLRHETQGTEDVPRLLIGPMSEQGKVVGPFATVIYYATRSIALQNGVMLGVGGNTIKTINNISAWKIASIGNTPSNDSTIYNTGDNLSLTLQEYRLYPAAEDEKTCCPNPSELKGISYDTRLDIKIGTIMRQSPTQRPLAYTDRMNIIKSISASR